MPAILSALPLRARRGVTLLEMLVVLVVMAISAAIVLPALARGAPGAKSESHADDLASVVASARRAAIARGEPVRLHVGVDGVWALVSLRAGVHITSGRIATTTNDTGNGDHATIDLRIDAMGSCVPSPSARDVGPSTDRFDPVSCGLLAERPR